MQKKEWVIRVTRFKDSQIVPQINYQLIQFLVTLKAIELKPAIRLLAELSDYTDELNWVLLNWLDECKHIKLNEVPQNGKTILCFDVSSPVDDSLTWCRATLHYLAAIRQTDEIQRGFLFGYAPKWYEENPNRRLLNMHKIIRDEEQLRKFIAWLPELRKDEAYFVCLQARKKYMPSLKANDKCQLKRFVSTKDRLFDKIKQLECPVGSYLTNEGEAIGDDALVLYITINPRDMRKATFASIKSLVSLIESNDPRDLNPHSEVLSQIHKCKARSVFVHFDIDAPQQTESDKNSNKCSFSLDEIYNKSIEFVGKQAVEIIQTRGGCHVLVRPELVVGVKNWHWAFKTTLNCDQSGDLMIPVVGCCQGNFVPSFYEPKVG